MCLDVVKGERENEGKEDENGSNYCALRNIMMSKVTGGCSSFDPLSLFCHQNSFDRRNFAAPTPTWNFSFHVGPIHFSILTPRPPICRSRLAMPASRTRMRRRRHGFQSMLLVDLNGFRVKFAWFGVEDRMCAYRYWDFDGKLDSLFYDGFWQEPN